MCHFDEKFINLNFKSSSFFVNIFSVFLCYIEWQQKRSYLLRVISLQIKKVERIWFEFCAIIGSKKKVFFFYWPHFLRFQKSLFSFSIKNFHRINSPPEKQFSLFYVTVHLILIMLFRNALNHALKIASTTKEGIEKKKMNKN